MRRMKMKGEDWLELLDAYRLPSVDSGGDADFATLRAHLTKLCQAIYYHPLDVTQDLVEATKILKEFIQGLSQHNTFAAPLWRGLAEVEDEYTLLSVARYLLPIMWV